MYSFFSFSAFLFFPSPRLTSPKGKMIKAQKIRVSIKLTNDWNTTINASQNKPTDTQQQNTLSSSKKLLQNESSSVFLCARTLSALVMIIITIRITSQCGRK